jgi:hypothetical protein
MAKIWATIEERIHVRNVKERIGKTNGEIVLSKALFSLRLRWA